MDDREGVDMQQSTGGHWLDTGEGPVSVDPPAGRAEETPERSAWRTYLEHMQACEECPKGTFHCEQATELWRAYRVEIGHLPRTS